MIGLRALSWQRKWQRKWLDDSTASRLKNPYYVVECIVTYLGGSTLRWQVNAEPLEHMISREAVLTVLAKRHEETGILWVIPEGSLGLAHGDKFDWTRLRPFAEKLTPPGDPRPVRPSVGSSGILSVHQVLEVPLNAALFTVRR